MQFVVLSWLNLKSMVLFLVDCIQIFIGLIKIQLVRMSYWNLLYFNDNWDDSWTIKKMLKLHSTILFLEVVSRKFYRSGGRSIPKFFQFLQNIEYWNFFFLKNVLFTFYFILRPVGCLEVQVLLKIWLIPQEEESLEHIFTFGRCEVVLGQINVQF